MDDMKKAFIGFMTLLMLTPSLACAMTYCPMKASATEQSMPCHQTATDDGVMLILDCMGVDLFQQDASGSFSNDQPIESMDYAWVELVSEYGFQPNNTQSIRGPPDTFSVPHETRSIILTTQRFRV